MKRREFFKVGALMGASAAVSLKFDELQAALISNEIKVETAAPDMVAVMGGDPVIMLNKALEALGGIGNYVKKGQKIVIKPNIGWDRAPELAANTNPELVGALVKKCLEAGASKVSVFDHTCDNWIKCYKSSGIEEAVKAAGGIILPANDERDYSTVSLPKGIKLKSAQIHNALIEADAWINIPILKNHDSARLSCAMKNYMGIVWDRRFFHSNDLQQCIADICTWDKKPVLNIVDAYRMMFQNGPQGKSAADVNVMKTLIASRDIVAIDSAALQQFNVVKKLDPALVKHITLGENLKLGTADTKSINIKKIKV
jgi:uncharacterized protein (DUF362 family)